MTKLAYPFSESAVRALKAGDTVSISGLVHTGRDRFHKHFADGGTLPVDFRDGALYHCGPVVVRDGGEWKVRAAGPTTSVRENPYEPDFIAKTGVRLIIGKGGMDSATLAAMAKHGCVYIQSVGGAAALSAACVRRVVGVDLLDEFGAAEACWHFEMKDWTGVVAMDTHGHSLFAEVAERSGAQSALPEYELAGIETIARGVLVRDGKLLLCRARGGKSTYLPGGHIEFGETGREALVREMREEAGVSVGTSRFLGVVENSFLQHGKPHAEINLVYAMTLDESVGVTSKEDWISFEWCPLKNLAAANLLPSEFNRLAAYPRVTFAP